MPTTAPATQPDPHYFVFDVLWIMWNQFPWWGKVIAVALVLIACCRAAARGRL
ncbi:MAG: hypothetical protein H7144_02575 [Burkholderiales bacterium]|nr:hypothetical protein [Phycisphaerae bacterium]